MATGRPVGDDEPSGFVRAILESPTPMILVDLRRRSIMASNSAVSELVGMPHDEIVGREVRAFLDETSSAASDRSFDLLADGLIDSYRAGRQINRADGRSVPVEVWTRRVSEDQAIVAIVAEAAAHALHGGGAGGHPVATGYTDSSWRVQQVTAEIQTILGWDADRVRGTALLTTMHPEDVADVLLALDTTPEAGATTVPVRIRDADGRWRLMQCVLAPVPVFGDGRIAFAICELDESPEGEPDDRAIDLERHLLRIASEVRSAGLMDRLEKWPDPARFPQLNDLTTRQWDILGRLLDGDRVPTIARELYVSQSTVRNHLSTMFDKFGVHSQAELLALLR